VTTLRPRPAAQTLALLAATIAAVGVALAPAPAEASPATMQRALGNILWSPLDLALSPIVAFSTLNRNIRDIDDTTAVRVAYYVPGYLWLVGLQIGSAGIRGITGALELLPAIPLLFMDADLDPLFDPVERGEALVEFENPLLNVKFGINYQSPAF